MRLCGFSPFVAGATTYFSLLEPHRYQWRGLASRKGVARTMSMIPTAHLLTP